MHMYTQGGMPGMCVCVCVCTYTLAIGTVRVKSLIHSAVPYTYASCGMRPYTRMWLFFDIKDKPATYNIIQYHSALACVHIVVI